MRIVGTAEIRPKEGRGEKDRVKLASKSAWDNSKNKIRLKIAENRQNLPLEWMRTKEKAKFA